MTVVRAVFERYADDAALEAHMASSHVHELGLEDALPRLESRQRTTLIPLV